MSGSSPRAPSNPQAASTDVPPPSGTSPISVPVEIPSDDILLGPPRQGPAPLGESPWFWIYVFGTAGLIALFLVSPKFGVRQSAIEREYQGRTRAAENLNGRDPSLAMSTPGNTLITLQPLFFGVASITAVAWGIFWVSRRRAIQQAAEASSGLIEKSPPSRTSSPE